MRSPDEIQKLIIEKAKSDDRIRAVLLNGSRANRKIVPDKHQDFDVVYIVEEISSFIADHSWVDIFGERIIRQLPDEMNFGKMVGKEVAGFHYLMLLKDGNRIDLTLLAIDKIDKDFRLDSLTVLWLDKDNLFSKIPVPDDSDYLIRKPGEKEFIDTCNEFWWVCTYVSKGLLRNEITYSKEMLETVVRPMFMKIIEWHIGIENGFSVSFGKGGKLMMKYLTNEDYEKVLSTYSDQHVENNWKALFIMMELFEVFAAKVAAKLNFQYNSAEGGKSDGIFEEGL
jgi:aminoglycoside 6-adenylyltransferase